MHLHQKDFILHPSKCNVRVGDIAPNEKASMWTQCALVTRSMNSVRTYHFQIADPSPSLILLILSRATTKHSCTTVPLRLPNMAWWLLVLTSYKIEHESQKEKHRASLWFVAKVCVSVVTKC